MGSPQGSSCPRLSRSQLHPAPPPLQTALLCTRGEDLPSKGRGASMSSPTGEATSHTQTGPRSLQPKLLSSLTSSREPTGYHGSPAKQPRGLKQLGLRLHLDRIPEKGRCSPRAGRADGSGCGPGAEEPSPHASQGRKRGRPASPLHLCHAPADTLGLLEGAGQDVPPTTPSVRKERHANTRYSTRVPGGQRAQPKPITKG